MDRLGTDTSRGTIPAATRKDGSFPQAVAQSALAELSRLRARSAPRRVSMIGPIADDLVGFQWRSRVRIRSSCCLSARRQDSPSGSGQTRGMASTPVPTCRRQPASSSSTCSSAAATTPAGCGGGELSGAPPARRDVARVGQQVIFATSEDSASLAELLNGVPHTLRTFKGWVIDRRE